MGIALTMQPGRPDVLPLPRIGLTLWSHTLRHARSSPSVVRVATLTVPSISTTLKAVPKRSKCDPRGGAKHTVDSWGNASGLTWSCAIRRHCRYHCSLLSALISYPANRSLFHSTPLALESTGLGGLLPLGGSEEGLGSLAAIFGSDA